MQTTRVCRVLGAVLLAALASCSGSSDNPYTAHQEPAARAGPAAHRDAGHRQFRASPKSSRRRVTRRFSSPLTIPASVSVEASLWSVPEPVAASATHFKVARGGRSQPAGAPDGAGRGQPVGGFCGGQGVLQKRAGQRTCRAGRRQSSGPDKVRVQVWTYLIPDVLAANKRLRESGIPVVYDPVRITTAYLGDHKTMAIRAPDGTIIELVETASQ